MSTPTVAEHSTHISQFAPVTIPTASAASQMPDTRHEDRRFYSPEQTLRKIKGYGNPGIYRLLEVIRPVAQGTDMLQVLDVFRDHQQEHFFPVLDAEGRPAGLVCERSLKSYVYSRFGMALLANRSQAKVLENFLTPCPSVEIDVSTAKVLEAAHELAGTEGVLITVGGQYVGFVRASSLVELAHEQQMEIVHRHNVELDRKNTEIQAVLQNMRQGICTILPDLTLHPDHSTHLLSILEQDVIAGESILAVLFDCCEMGADQRQQVEAALMAILDQDELMFACNAHLLPTELQLVFSGQTKILELHWSPMVSVNSLTERLMLVVRDVSQIRQLQQEAAQHQRELQLLGDILAAGEHRFLRFMQGSQQSLADCRRLLVAWRTDGVDDTSDMLSALYRHLHTIKGNARTLRLNAVTNSLHHAEQVLQSARDSGSVPDGLAMREALRQVEQDFGQYNALYQQRLKGFGSKSDVPVSEGVSLLDLSAQVFEGLSGIATELGKACPEALLSGDLDKVFVRSEHRVRLESVMTHILRNSIDHGIESAVERQSIGKSALATVSVSLEKDSTGVRLIIADDGRGLALSKLRDKARLMGLASPTGNAAEEMTDDEVAELIFHNGLSTATHVSMISGRGVGMDAVRHLLAEAGATVQVRWLSTASRHRSHRPFALHIQLPEGMLLSSRAV